MSPEMAKVLGELTDLMEGRAMTLAERAVEDKASWLKRLGTPPTTATARRRWLREVEGRRALGAPANEAQKLDAARAEQAIRRARAIAEDTANAQDGRSRALDARGRAIG
jgi:hypothetical protein